MNASLTAKHDTPILKSTFFFCNEPRSRIYTLAFHNFAFNVMLLLLLQLQQLSL